MKSERKTLLISVVSFPSFYSYIWAAFISNKNRSQLISGRGKGSLDINRLLKKRGKINLRNDGIRRVGYSCRPFSFFFPLISLTTKTKSQNNNCMINSHVFLHGISSKTGITPIMILISSLAFWWFLVNSIRYTLAVSETGKGSVLVPCYI